MRELTMNEVSRVGGGFFDGECNVDLGSYLVATAGLMLISGPLSAVTAFLGWGFSTYGLQSCVDSYNTGYLTMIDEYGCHRISS